MSYTTATKIGQITAPLIAKIAKGLKKSLNEDTQHYEGALKATATLFSKRLEDEYNYCQNCSGLPNCQYAAIGNTGFRPIWKHYSRLYTHVTECRYKREQGTRARLNRLFGESGMPAIYQNLTLREVNHMAKIDLLNFLSGKSPFIYLKGPASSGKSKLASATGNELIMLNIDVLYTTVLSLTTALRFQNPEYYDRLNELVKIPALIIEDLPITLSSYNQEQIDMVLERRQRQNLRTLLTSANAIEELRVSDELKRRLMQMQGLSLNRTSGE